MENKTPDEVAQTQALLDKYENELTAVVSLLSHHRDEARRLEARMIELREATVGLRAFYRVLLNNKTP